MWLKFALIVAVAFITQALAAESEGYSLRSMEGILEAVKFFDAIGASAIEARRNGLTTSEIIACFTQQKGELIALQKILSEAIINFDSLKVTHRGTIMAKLGVAADHVNKIINTFVTATIKVWGNIKNNEFLKVLKAFKEIEALVYHNTRKLMKVLEEIKKKAPEVSMGFESVIKSLGGEVKRASEKITKGFKECLVESHPTPKTT